MLREPTFKTGDLVSLTWDRAARGIVLMKWPSGLYEVFWTYAPLIWALGLRTETPNSLIRENVNFEESAVKK